MTYTQRIEYLQLSSLWYKRLRGNMIQILHIINGKLKRIVKSFFSLLIMKVLDQGCPTRGPRAAMRPAWCLGAAHYSFSLQVVFFSKIVTISSKRVERA